MAFRKKAAIILAHQPDILIVPECEHPDKLLFPAGTPTPTNILWFGENPNKGLAIFSYGNYALTLLENHNRDFQMIIPIGVSGGEFDFNLFAIWANNPTDKDGRYIEQVWKAVSHYDALLTGKPSIWMGDFNSNKIWDKQHRKSNHSDVVKLLEDKKILSTYHLFHRQEQGTEIHPTLYMYRHKDKAYHIDYCFVSAEIAEKVQSVEIGEYEFWTKHSDHVPVIVTFDKNGPDR
jgi:exonuclease III